MKLYEFDNMQLSLMIIIPSCCYLCNDLMRLKNRVYAYTDVCQLEGSIKATTTTIIVLLSTVFISW